MMWRVVVRNERGVSVLVHVPAADIADAARMAYEMAGRLFAADDHGHLSAIYFEEVAA